MTDSVLTVSPGKNWHPSQEGDLNMSWHENQDNSSESAGLEIWRSEVQIPVLVQVFLLRSYNVKFPKAQTMGLVPINNLI